MFRKQGSTSYPMQFFMTLASDHISGATGLTPTVTLSKNGGAFAAAAGAVTEVGNGWYALAGNATDRNTLGEVKLHATAATADASEMSYMVVPWDVFDANLSLQALAGVAAAGGSGGLPVCGTNVPTAAPGGSGGLPTLDAALNVAGDLRKVAGQGVTCSAAVTVYPYLGTQTSAPTVDASGRVDVGKHLGSSISLDSNNYLNVNTKDWGGLAAGGMPNSGAVTLAASQPNYAPALAGAAMALTTSERGSVAVAVRDVDDTTPAAGSLGAKVNAAAAAGDPWSATLPGSYTGSQAGAMLAAISTAAGKLTFDGSNYLYSHLKVYDAGLSPDALVWGAGTASYAATGTFGAAAGVLNKFIFDGSNNVYSTVRSYLSTQSPAALVWGATAATYAAAGTMGALQNAAVVGSYASGAAPDLLVWSASVTSYNVPGTFGGKVAGLSPNTDPWATAIGGAYSGTQAGAMLAAIGAMAGNVTFDASNNVKAVVEGYGTGLGPDAMVWSAPSASYTATGTMGGVLNALSGGGGGGTPTDPWAASLGGYPSGQAGYAVNQMANTVAKLTFDVSNNVLSNVAAYGTGLAPAAEVWGAAPSGNTVPGTMGALLGSASAGDPWAKDVRSGYASTSAGAFLNAMNTRIDDSISNVPGAIMGYAVYSNLTMLQATRLAAAGVGGVVARIGTSNQFNLYPANNPTASPIMTGTTDSDYLTRFNIILSP